MFTKKGHANAHEEQSAVRELGLALGDRELGGYDPQHAQAMLDFARDLCKAVAGELALLSAGMMCS